jgi:4'-phosphopantetheinyl transferase
MFTGAQREKDPAFIRRAGHADCWILSLADTPDQAASVLLKLLTQEERGRAARFHHQSDRARFIASHAALRFLLASYLHKEPSSLVFAENANGRPYLANGEDVSFNLSHAGDFALIAAIGAGAIGVDIEQIREMADFISIARQHFAPDEFDRLVRAPAERQLSFFYTTWTRKEAFVKAIGQGLSFSLNAFTTGDPAQAPSLEVEGRACPDWTISDLSLPAGYAGALVVASPAIAVRCMHFDWSWLFASLSKSSSE